MVVDQHSGTRLLMKKTTKKELLVPSRAILLETSSEFCGPAACPWTSLFKIVCPCHPGQRSAARASGLPVAAFTSIAKRTLPPSLRGTRPVVVTSDIDEFPVDVF